MKKAIYDRMIGGYPQEYHTHMIDWDNIALSILGAAVIGFVANLIVDFVLSKGFGVQLFYLPLTEHFSLFFGDSREAYLSWIDQLKFADGWLFKVRCYSLAILPALFAVFAAKWSYIVRPLEVHVRGRQLIEGKAAIETLANVGEVECESDRPGVYLHPHIQLSRTRESGNIFIAGTAGGGKSTIIEPIIFEYVQRSKKGRARVVIYDFKKEFYQKLGLCMLIAPWDERTWAIDIAEDINSDAAVREFIADIIPVSEKDPFWGNASRGIGVAMLLNFLHLKKTEKKVWGWNDIHEMLFATDEEVEKWVVRFNPLVIQAVKDIKENKQAQTIMLNLKASMGELFVLAKAWRNVPKERLVSIKRFALDTNEKYPKEYKGRVLVFQHDTRYPTLSNTVAQMILKSLNNYVTSAKDDSDRCIPLILDEFPQLGNTPVVSRILATARSKGMPVIVGIQDTTQLIENLGAEEAKTFMQQFKTKVIVKFTMGDSAKHMSDMIGSYTYRRAEMRKDLPPGTPPFTEGSRLVIEADEIDSKLGTSKSKWTGVRALIIGMDENAHIVTFPFSNHQKGKHRPSVDAEWLNEIIDYEQLAKDKAAAKAAGNTNATVTETATSTAASNTSTSTASSIPSSVSRIARLAANNAALQSEWAKPDFQRQPPADINNGRSQTQASIVPQAPLTDEQVKQAGIDDMMSFLPSVHGEEDESPVDEVVKTAAVDEAAHALGAIVPGADIAVHAIEVMTDVFDDKPQAEVVSTGEPQMKIQQESGIKKFGKTLVKKTKKREFGTTEIDDGYDMK